MTDEPPTTPLAVDEKDARIEALARENQELGSMLAEASVEITSLKLRLRMATKK